MVSSRIIKSPKGKFVRDFTTDPLGQKHVDITFRRRGKLGKILKGETTKRIRVPKGNRIISIINNNPKVGSVKINFIKLKQKKKK